MTRNFKQVFASSEWPYLDVWEVEPHKDGYRIIPHDDGSLPPANEAGADPVEVEAAEIAAQWHQREPYWKGLRMNETFGWVRHIGSRASDDAGWLARQIVEEG